MGRNCSVKNCFKNDSRNFNTSFYKFPDDVDLCGQWVQFCGSEELEAAFVAAGPYGIRGRKICSDHFSRDCFRMPERTEKGLKYGAVPRLDANEENYFDVEYLEDETVQDDSLTAACNAAMRSSTGCWTVSHISSDALTDNVRPEVYRLDFNDKQDFKIIKNSNATTSSPTNNGQPTWSESSFIEESISKVAPGPEACNMDCDDELFSTTSPSAARRSSTGSWTVSHLSADALTDNVRPEVYLLDFNNEQDFKIIKNSNATTSSPTNNGQPTWAESSFNEESNAKAAFGPDACNMDCDDELLSTMSPGAAKRSSTESCTVSHLSTDASPTDNARPEVLTGDTGVTFSKTTGKTKIKKSDRKLKEKLRATERTSARRAAAIKRKTAEINDLKKQIRNLKKQRSCDHKLITRVRKNCVLYDSLKNEGRKLRSRQYSDQTKKFALSLYLSGPRTYRMVKNSKTLVLPSKRAIKRWMEKVKIRPGLNPVILKCVAAKTKTFDQKDRVVAVSMDGMKIRASLTYSAKSDVFYGFPDDGSNRRIQRNDPKKLATEAVAVLVQGVGRKYKQGLGYYLTHNTLGSVEQMKIVKSTIRALRDINLVPKVLVMDQFTTNTKMAREAGATVRKPFFLVDDDPVYVMWDPPHLTKSTRNNLKKHNAVFGARIASFGDIEKLFELDSVASPRLAPRLTEKHIIVPPFSPMNVSLAVRVLSQSVATAIRWYVEQGQLPQRALQTAEFLEINDKLFDTFNSRSETCRSKPFKAALKEDSCHWKFLEQTKQILLDMYYTTKDCVNLSEAKEKSGTLTKIQRLPPYITGYISNINALQLLWNDLHLNYGFEFLCTNQIDQDKLENLFSEVRRKLGANDSPDVAQFGAAFKYSIIESNIMDKTGSNCEIDDSTPLLTDADISVLINAITPDEVKHTYKFIPLDTTTPLEVSTKVLNGLVYTFGSAVRKLPHKKCMANLKTEDQDRFINDDAYSFLAMKNSASGLDLMIPNNKLYEIGILCYAAFEQKFRHFLYQNKAGVKTRLKAYLDYAMFDDGLCEKCFDRLVDAIFNTMFEGFLKQIRSLNSKTKFLKKFKRNRKAIKLGLPV